MVNYRSTRKKTTSLQDATSTTADICNRHLDSGALDQTNASAEADRSNSVMGSTVSEPSSACRQDGKTQTTGAPQPTRQKSNPSQSHPTSKIFDDASTIAGYQSVPLIDIDVLPRGGISFETKAVGRIQFGIPPETIKDSMIFGMEVPSVYIIPIERFCRELGPALGLNMAEFEFPAYFNYFVRGKKVQLVVESADAENDIRNVFGETLLGPECFRDDRIPCANVDEDFDPSFPKDCRPDFYKEFRHFRTSEKTEEYPELCIDTLLDFVHFSRDRATDRESNNILGVPPTLPEFEVTSDHNHLDVKMADCGVPRTMTATMSEKVETDKPPLPGPPSGGMRRNSTSAGQVLLKGTVQSYWNGDDNFSDPKSMHDIPIGNLKRSSSDSTLSSNHSHSSEKQRRRGSAEWIKDSADESFLSPRQNLLEAVQTLSSPMRNFGLLDRSIKIRESSKRDSLTSLASIDSDQPNNVLGRRFSRIFMMSTGTAANALGYEFMEEGDDLRQRHWMYSQAKWLGDVATIYPPHVKTARERKSKCARVEIFRMAGGTEYIVHDIDENNVIIGKTRFSGTVRVPDELSVQGFLSSIDNMSSLISSRTEIGKSTILGPDNGSVDATFAMSSRIAPTPKFFPPSFGVTVLGNSHGFDKNGATSGYVLWINGRGIMIDPPPFSSSTLEREGIRPQMITAIIITHCHADHDAGAFQKIMTGSRVAIITTPTIYRSFLRKYSALSGLRPSLLRHSHRHRPAIIGQPLRFQGAIFHFTYTLHTIPCISFKVEWRGRSIVFTGDHMNIPEQIDRLEREGTLSKGRADDLRKLPMQDCDVLLHEAGVPPIHTPVSVLQALPAYVKDRLYVVHTAAVPVDSGLKVAPTGTAGTIRLFALNETFSRPSLRSSAVRNIDISSFQDGSNQNLSIHGEASSSIAQSLSEQVSGTHSESGIAPLILLRPTDTSDAWFILNLLAAVPFLSSLSYGHTMEILEIANVQVFCDGEVVIEGVRRPDFLCVVWEGTCMEDQHHDNGHNESTPVVWYSGDWMGPLSLQPDASRSSRPDPINKSQDIFAVSKEGTKVIFLPMKDVNRILKAGSALFRKYIAIEDEQKTDCEKSNACSFDARDRHQTVCDNDKLLDVLQCNYVLGNLYATQKRHLESLAEGPRCFPSQSSLWNVGDPVSQAYIIVSGTATFGRTSAPVARQSAGRRGSTGDILRNKSEHRTDSQRQNFLFSLSPLVESDKVLPKVSADSEYARLETLLKIRAEDMEFSSSRIDSRLLDNDDCTQLVVSAYRDRFANKILRKLYSRHAYTENLVFSRGTFLCDISRMVSGDIAENSCDSGPNINSLLVTKSRSSLGSSLVGDHHFHTSNLIAGPTGCIVMSFPRDALVSFLDNNPGILLSLLGTQAVV